MLREREVRNLSCPFLCLSYSTLIASLSVMRGTFESELLSSLPGLREECLTDGDW